MKVISYWLMFFMSLASLTAQDITLDYFIAKSKENVPALKENNNLLKIGELQSDIILAQNNAFKVDATSEVLVSPYFNNNGNFIDITTTPSPSAYGYDVGITNGGLYSAQLNVTKNLFNQAVMDNLLFQNKIKNNAIVLSSEEIGHNLTKTITDTYILAYQFQLQEEFTQEILNDLEKRLQVVEVLAKRGVLMESDYLLLQLDVETKKSELRQLRSNFKKSVDQLYTLSGIPLENVGRLSKPIFISDQSASTYFYEKKFENDSLLVVADKSVFENRYKPQISFYANTGLNAVELQNIEHEVGANAGLSLTIPIYDGNQRKLNEMQSELKRENLEYYKENSKLQLENNLKSIKEQIQFMDANINSLENQLEKQEDILEIYKGKLVQGQISIIDYLNVEQSYKLKVQAKLQMLTNRWLLESQYNFINW